MQFLNPWILGGLLFAAIPIIIHLINKRRHRTIKWAAMMFLLQANRQSRGKRRLRNILILACRVLALAAIITAIARPIAGGWLGWAGNSSPETIVLIFDRSPSMEVKDALGEQSKRANAIARLSKALKDFAGGAKIVLIDSATRQPLALSTGADLADLPQTGQSDAAADIPALLTTALDFLSASPGENAEIWIASDMQASNWEPESGVWKSLEDSFGTLPTDVPIRVLALTGSSNSATPNLAVSATGIERNAQSITVDLQFTNESKNLVEVPLSITLDGGAESQQTIELPSGVTNIRKRFQIDAAKLDAGFGSVSLPADPNERDNTAWFTYSDLSPLKTAVVSTGGQAGKRLALAAAPTSLTSRSVDIFDAADWQRIDWDSTSLVIWQAPIVNDDGLASALRTYVERGGNLAIFPTDDPTSSSDSAVIPDLLGMRFANSEPAPEDGQFIITDWNRDSGPFQNFEDGSSPALDRLFVIRRSPVSFEGAIPQALYADDQPFCMMKRSGAGSILAFTTLPDDRWSDLLQHNVLFPAIQRLIASGSKRIGGSRLLSVGEKLPATESAAWQSLAIGSDEPASASQEPVVAGIYQDTDKQFLTALNIPTGESDLDRLDVATVSELFVNKPIRVFEERVTRETDLASPVWRFFAYAVLAFLFIEALLSIPTKTEDQPTSA